MRAIESDRLHLPVRGHSLLGAALEISRMNQSLWLWLTAFLAGAALAPLGVPGDALVAVFLIAFLAIIVTYYRSAIRQGHSGLVVLPLKKGPFGYDGLQLKLNKSELRVTLGSAFLVAGILTGAVIAMTV